MDITHDYKIIGLLWVDESGPALKIENRDGKYNMFSFAVPAGTWFPFPQGGTTLSDAIGMAETIATRKGIEEFKLNERTTSADEFNRTIINLELKNKLPLDQLVNVKEIADWNKISKMIKDEHISPHEYKTFKKIIGKYESPKVNRSV